MKRLVAAVLLGLALLVACTGGGSGGVVLSRADDGQTVEVRVGESVTLQLDANETTGYAWVLAEQPDERVLRFVSQEYQAPVQSTSPRTGAGGRALIRFRATGAGTATAQLVYRQPWLDGAERDRFRFTVHVR